MRTVALTLAFSCIAAAQQLSFEVASIKPAPKPTPETARPSGVDGTRVQINGYTPEGLVAWAFRVTSQQVIAPDSARSAYFDVQAKLPEGATRDQLPEMLQAMLVERFKLSYHHEMRDYQVNVLAVGKNGMKLPRLPDDTRPSTTTTPLPGGGVRATVVGKVTSIFGAVNSFGGLSMVDETGLDGIYSWVREQEPVRPGMTYADTVRESFRIMVEAAGLKMETRKVPKDTIIVDHIKKSPTEN